MSEENKNPASTVNCLVLTMVRVVLPGEEVEISVGEDAAGAIYEAYTSESQVFLAIPKTEGSDSIDPQDLQGIGTIGSIVKVTQKPDGGIDVRFQAQTRGRMLEVTVDGQNVSAQVKPVSVSAVRDAEISTLAKGAFGILKKYLETVRQMSPEAIKENQGFRFLYQMMQQKPHFLSDELARALDLSEAQRRALLLELDSKKRLATLCKLMGDEIKTAEQKNGAETALLQKASDSATQAMTKEQREYVLRRQIKALQKELGEDGDGEEELNVLAEKIKNAGMSAEAQQKCERELKKLKSMNPASPEKDKLRDYLEVMVSLPWSKTSAVMKDLKRAQEILDEDHYGLDKVKARILERLAVQQLSDKAKGRIMCLVGPPGVGKTSLGKSIARATGREFVRISLGGVQGESDIRGHRRTYVGAMPGRIVAALQKASTGNPVIQFDEIDKLSAGKNVNGDPSAAMLEVLDPEQNDKFHDHYLDVDYDLSPAMHICTANELGDIPGPLRDRMEIIHVPAYSEEEKLEIAKRHLVRKVTEGAGLTASQFSVSDEALRVLINDYTMEAGVRGLERVISGLADRAARQIVDGAQKSAAITPENLEKYLTSKKVSHHKAGDADRVGFVNGLAVVGGVGGDVLPIEAVKISAPKGGGVGMTGLLGETMKESITVAEMFVRSRAEALGIDPDVFETASVHIHAPEAIPKDGPSAGLAMVTSIVSVLTGTPVRRDVAMTGEVDLLGNSMPIGGVREKLTGAFNAGIKKVLIPQANVKDLKDVPQRIKDGLTIVPVDNVMQVLQEALTEMPQPFVRSKNSAAAGDAQLQEILAKALAQVFAQAASKVPANDSRPPVVGNSQPSAASVVGAKGRPSA